MSAESSVSNSDKIDSGSSYLSPDPSGRVSIEGSVNLNDDLAAESEYSFNTSSLSQTTQALHSNSSILPRRSGSFLSHRNSTDGDSSFSSSAHFNVFHNHSSQEDSTGLNETFSPLGPNSIYELTIGSDTARSKRNRAPKTQVTLNGGLTTVNNLRTPTTKDIPQIQLVSLKNKPSTKDLEGLLVKDLVDEYKSFESSYKQLTEDTLQKFIEQDKFTSHLVDNNSEIVSSPSSENFELLKDNQDDITKLIPSVYLDEDFRLDDPRIFKQVIEGCKILPDTEIVDEETHLASDTELQEKLSHYLDVIEVKLVNEISKSSDSFFNTLGAIQEISGQSKECIDKFHDIMSKLQYLEDHESQVGLEILNKIEERKNVEQLESSILQLQSVLSVFDLAKKSFQNGKHNKCLNEILVVEHLIRGSGSSDFGDLIVPTFDYPLTDFSDLPALNSLKSELYELKDLCSKGYISDFIELLLEDLRSHYNSVPSQDTLNRIYVSVDSSKRYGSYTINRSYQVIDESKTTKLRNFIQNLSKSGRIADAYLDYQNKIITEIKDIIKFNLPKSNQGLSSVDMSNTPSRASPAPDFTSSVPSSSSNSLSVNLRAMSPSEFETMLMKTYTTLSECLRRLTAHQKTLLDLALTAIPPSAAQGIDVMSLDLTVAINKAIELTQIRLTKIINVRSEQIADLTLPYYLRYYALSSAYLQECEFINPGYVASGPGSSLNDWVKNHISYFVHRFHSNSMKRVATECDREVWKEVTDTQALEDHQGILNELLEYGEYIESNGKRGFSGGSWIKDLDIFQDSDTVSAPEAKKTSENSINKLKIGQDTFMVPNISLSIIRQIKDYVTISKVFPSKSHTVKLNILNFFKYINSKASQAVLNAGATRTAGLKHITTKHLALCIQFVEFNMEFLKLLENIFKSTSPPPPPPPSQPNHLSQAEEPTFSRIISNYKDHENELFSKLVSIMYDRTVSHCQTLTNTNWSLPLKHPQQCHNYMETLVKETTTVSKVLSKYLPPEKHTLILSQIFDNYKKLLVECCCTQLPQFKDFNEKHSLLKDIDYLRVKLCELPGYGNSGQVIWENVNSLPTIEDARMEEVMRFNIAGEQKQSAANSKKNSIEVVRSRVSAETSRPSTPRKSLENTTETDKPANGAQKEAAKVIEKELPPTKREVSVESTEKELPALNGKTESNSEEDVKKEIHANGKSSPVNEDKLTSNGKEKIDSETKVEQNKREDFEKQVEDIPPVSKSEVTESESINGNCKKKSSEVLFEVSEQMEKEKADTETIDNDIPVSSQNDADNKKESKVSNSVSSNDKEAEAKEAEAKEAEAKEAAAKEAEAKEAEAKEVAAKEAAAKEAAAKEAAAKEEAGSQDKLPPTASEDPSVNIVSEDKPEPGPESVTEAAEQENVEQKDVSSSIDTKNTTHSKKKNKKKKAGKKKK